MPVRLGPRDLTIAEPIIWIGQSLFTDRASIERSFTSFVMTAKEGNEIFR